MIPTLRADLSARIARIDSLPTVPTIIRTLLKLLAAPQDQVDVDEVIEAISRDKTIVAQVLRVSNSALFSPARPVESVRGGVACLGLRRVQEIVFACTFCQTLRFKEVTLDPLIFWRHSFGTALVSRKFSRLIDFPNPEQAYLGGLLHDIGFQVNSLIDPEGWRATMHQALSTQVPLLDAELSVLGYTHCQTGRILAEQWQLPAALADVIEFHHEVENAPEPRDIVAIIHLSDLFCRMRDMGYGYYEPLGVDFMADPAWTLLAGQFRKLASMDLALFTFELDTLMDDVQRMVEDIFSEQTVTR
jgi:putative nucleotidyltransferase with HDIG domain